MIPKKVKIVATLGPASDNAETVFRMAEAGVNVFRINLSHATQEEIINRITWARNAEKKIGKPIAVMGDLAGPKIRIGEMEDGVIIEKDQKIVITYNKVVGNKEKFSLNYPSIIPQLRKGAEVFIDDGKLKLEVVEEGNKEVIAKVLVGGLLKPRKGFNAQGISLASKGLSDKDKHDLQFVIEKGADAIAISFVQSEKDVRLVRELLPKKANIMLVAKIETMRGMEEIEKIITAADAIMVARGDLGLAIPMEEIPHLQKRIIDMCLMRAKPVITATQMLESMTTNPIPTRAEVTDVANAILDGTDAVMLSGESAAGEFPVETVEMMARIIRRTTAHVEHRVYKDDADNVPHAVSSAAGLIADEIKARIIVAFTESGKTARRIARHRHSQIVLALTPDQSSWRQLNFTAGVYSFQIDPVEDFDNLMKVAKQIVRKNPVISLEKGEPFVIVAGMPFRRSGTTNLIYVENA